MPELYKGKVVVGDDTARGVDTSTTTTTPTYQQISPLSDLSFAKLFELIQSITPQALPGIEQITTQGMESPLLQSVLGPALARLQAPQAQQRQQLTEATRAAGGLRGSTYSQDFGRLQQNQALQTNDLMAQVIQQVLGTLISGQLQSQQNQMLPGRSLTELLRTIAPSNIPAGTTTTATSPTGSAVSAGPTRAGGAGSGWENIPPSQGLNTPMGGGPSTSPDDRDAQSRGYSSAAAMRFQKMLDAQIAAGGGAGGGGGGGSVLPYKGTTVTPYLDPLSGASGASGGSFDLGRGAGTEFLHSLATAIPFEPVTPYESVTEGWW